MRLTRQHTGQIVTFHTFHGHGAVTARVVSVKHHTAALHYQGGRTSSGKWIPVNPDGYIAYVPANSDRVTPCTS